MGTVLEIEALEIAAAASAAQGHLDDAIATMQQATALEEKMPPPPGPPPVIKPAHELFGEILLRADRPAEAALQFATALDRHPNRARALLGAALTTWGPLGHLGMRVVDSERGRGKTHP